MGTYMSIHFKKQFRKHIKKDKFTTITLSFVVLAFLLSLLRPGITTAEANRQDERSDGFLSLAFLLDEVLKVNPEIQAALERVEESRSRIPQSGALPDPDFELEGSNVGSRRITLGEEPESMISFKISQEFPVAGKRGVRKQIAATEADQAFQNLRGKERRVIAILKSNYYDLQALYKAQEIIEKNKELLNEVKVALLFL